MREDCREWGMVASGNRGAGKGAAGARSRGERRAQLI